MKNMFNRIKYERNMYQNQYQDSRQHYTMSKNFFHEEYNIV